MVDDMETNMVSNLTGSEASLSAEGEMASLKEEKKNPDSLNSDNNSKANDENSFTDSNTSTLIARRKRKPLQKSKFMLEIHDMLQLDDIDYPNDYKKYRLRVKNEKNTMDEIADIDEESEPMPKRRSRYDDDDDIVCRTCYKSFPSRTGLLNHMRVHVKTLKYTCLLCYEVFDTNKDLIKHKAIHKEEDRSFMCDICKQAFTDHGDYLLHAVAHQNKSLYKCDECGLYYKSRTGFKIHILSHTDKRTECHICKCLIKANSFNNHVKAHSASSHNCVECGKTYSDLKSMNYHLMMHTGVKPFQCLYCGKGFRNQSQRKIHTRIHTGERPYECDVCHKKFRQAIDMNRHKDSYHNAKSLTCDVCDKRFNHKESLKSHMSVHNKTERYKCNLCNKAISTYAGVRVHMIYVHSDARPFRCDYCEMTFKTNRQLVRHKTSIRHKNNEFGMKLKKLKE